MIGNETMSIREHAQTALGMLNCSHPDGGVSELRGVLRRLDPAGADAAAIRRAIDRLEELAEEVAKVEYALADVDFSFGRIEV